MPDNPFNSVDHLIETFSRMGGFQKSNRFEVLVTPPTGLAAPIVPFFASSVQIPSHITNYYQDSMAPSGSNIDIPLRRQYDQRFIIDFIVDVNWEVRKFFDSWTDLIFPNQYGSKNALMVNYWNNVTGNIIINAMTENADYAKQIQLNGAWPGTIIAGQFSNDIPNQYLTLQVDINYRNYILL
jgi:hypothetical protein